MFGRKENKTTSIPIDSVNTYKSTSSTNTSYYKAFISVGMVYDDTISKNMVLRLGLSGNLGQNLTAKQQVTRETFAYDFSGNQVTIDSVYKSAEENGTIKLPSSFTGGVTLVNIKELKGLRWERSSVGIEYESTQWADYRFYGQQDKLQNSWKFRAGGQFIPNATSTNYWNWVSYRAGFYFGKEAINADGNGMNTYSFSLGAGFPVRKHRSYDNQSTFINTTFELGKRGGSSNAITESFFRFSVGLNLSDVWFVKRRYD